MGHGLWAQMKHKTLFALLAVLAILSPGLARSQQNPIQHIVVIFQENRTPDNLFHDPVLIAAGADIASSGLNSKGQIIPLKPISLATNYDLRHGHLAFLNQYDNGLMDGTDKNPASCIKGAKFCPPSNPGFKYVKAGDVAPYFQMAEQYVFADRMFQTNQGDSFPAHQFIISGTSAPTADSDLLALSNPLGLPHAISQTGCKAPTNEFVFMIDPLGVWTKQYPCFDHPTLTDLLDNQGISWRYYTPTAGSIWTGPNAISHIRFGPAWSNVIMKPTQVLTDISKGRLPAVSWVIPIWWESDHPGSPVSLGPSWVASIVNAIGASPYWNNTAIFITWDDWGGWYDHVAPPIISSYAYGFRVPLVIISPYAKQGYVSHVQHDFGSILKFTEKVFGLPSLGYADAKADDLSDCFDLLHWHAFRRIQAPHDANYFLHTPLPVIGPDDD